MTSEKNPILGILAGVAGGLAASWVMNEFMAGPGKKLQHTLQSNAENREEQAHSGKAKEDATMKVADAVVNTATGGRHLSWEGKQKGGPVVHYAFGALMGGIYGGLAEFSSDITAGFGTAFGGMLFSGADLLAVPALHLGPSPTTQSASSLASPFAAHIVYGTTTELVRRIVRSAL